MDVRFDSVYSSYMAFNSALPDNPDFRIQSNLARNRPQERCCMNSGIFEMA
jgi:hypothetical protein